MNKLMTPAARYLRTGLLAVLALAVAPFAAAGDAAPVLPTDSVYQLKAPLTDQSGKASTFAERRGHPVLVGMFYTSCQFVCPMLVDTLRDTEAQLTPQERAKLGVLLVTIDPARDTVAVLKRTFDQRSLDPAHWTMVRTDAKTTRKLAAVLGVQFRALPNGDFNHTTDLILLDSEGRITGRTAQLGSADPAFVKQVKLATQ